jgi:hypothetical protein
MSGAVELWEAAPHLYSQLLDRAYLGGEIPSELAEIEKDLHRTFPGHSAFGDGSEGRARLRDVLAAYALRNQTVGYCQVRMRPGVGLDIECFCRTGKKGCCPVRVRRVYI